MERYIDIDKMKKWTEVDQSSCSRERCASTNYDCNECYYNNGGAEDVAPVIHAKWIEKEWAEEFDNRLISNYECSNCKEWLRDKSNYCPNCGAKMDKEQVDMSTSSIFKNFVISGKEQVETFVNAIEMSKISYSKSFNITESQITDIQRIKSIIDKRKIRGSIIETRGNKND